MSEKPISPIKVLLIDDHQFVRIGLRTIIDQTPDIKVIGEAESLKEASVKVLQLKPTVVLLDVQLPDGSGFDTCRQVRALLPETKVIVLTAFADDQVIFDAIIAGADGYLLKDISGDALLESIRTVAKGRSILDPAITARVLGRIKQANASPAKSKLDLLSAQERRVIALVAQGKTNKEIGVELGLSDKTVKNYLSNALEKLQMRRRSQAAALFAGEQSK